MGYALLNLYLAIFAIAFKKDKNMQAKKMVTMGIAVILTALFASKEAAAENADLSQNVKNETVNNEGIDFNKLSQTAKKAKEEAAAASAKVLKAETKAGQADKNAALALEQLEQLKKEFKEKKQKEHYGYDKGFFITDKKELFKLKINARMQARYTFESEEEFDKTGARIREDKNNFAIPSARLKLKGHLFSKKINYAFQLDFGKGNGYLKDFYADFAFVKNVLHLRVGQWTTPFSRQEITSSGKLEFTGRAITDKAFAPGRDIGILLSNNFEKNHGLEWALGAFNGTGIKPWFKDKLTYDETTGHVTDVSGKFTNIPHKFNPMLVMRLGFNTGGLKGYSEADLEGGKARFGLAASGIFDFDADNSNDGNIRGELDYILKVHGFSTTGGFYAATRQNGKSFGDQEYGNLGFHAQAGYIIAGRLQPTFRYAFLNPHGQENYIQEILGGISVYIFKHNIKWQTEGGTNMHMDNNGRLSDAILKTQLQLAF
jgi:hypothetical protein